jgi:asparagine synthase (glutamine-hydrolysing)
MASVRHPADLPNRGGGLAVSPSGSVCAWDGRLDNQRELAVSLADRHLATAPPADVALAVYEMKGPAGFVDLVGDWSLAIWDEAARAIVLSSDYAGIRPLYYHHERGMLRWSSSLDHLSRWSGKNEEDERYWVEFLARGTVVGLTPYRGVLPVPPGAFVWIEPGRSCVRPFWRLRGNEAGLGGCEADYEAQLCSLLRQSIAARLDAPVPVCSELSGGMDSSSIVCVAADLIQEGSVGARSLIPFSYDQADSNDQKFIRVVELDTGLSARHLDISEYPPICEQKLDFAAPIWWAPRFDQVAHLMTEAGASLLLTGQMGDLVMGNWLDDSEQVADHLCAWDLEAAFREAFAWSQTLHVPVHTLLWRAFRLASARSGDIASYHLRKNTGGDSLTERARSLAEEQLASRPAPEWLSGAPPSRRKRLLALADVLSGRALQCPAPLAHLSWGHPFTHRPLVEFMMTIPSGVVCRPGEPRRLMRRALAGIVPDKILRRRSKGIYDSSFRSALRPLATALIGSVRTMGLVQRGYVEPESIEQRLRRLLDGLDCDEPQLRHVILLEYWSRRLKSGPGSQSLRAS